MSNATTVCTGAWINVGDFKPDYSGECVVNIHITRVLWSLNLVLIVGAGFIGGILYLRIRLKRKLKKKEKVLFVTLATSSVVGLALSYLKVSSNYTKYMIASHWLPGLFNAIHYVSFTSSLVAFLRRHFEYATRVATVAFIASLDIESYKKISLAGFLFLALLACSWALQFSIISCGENCRYWTQAFFVEVAVTYFVLVVFFLPRLFGAVADDMKNLESSMSDRHIVEEISSKRLALLKLLKYGQLLALGLILGGIIPFIDYLYGFLPYFAPILHINSNLIYVIGFKSMWEARRRRNGRTSTSVAIAPIHSEKHTSRECAKSSSFVASQ